SAPAWDITWIFYDHEEVDAAMNGLGRLAARHPELIGDADFAVLCEPSNAAIEGGCNGTLRARLRFHGRRAHSARPWTGQNAIHEAASALATLAAHVPDTVEVDGLEYREALSATIISGGVAANVIPDLAEITVNHRFAPSRSGAEAVARIEAMFPEAEVVIDDLAE